MLLLCEDEGIVVILWSLFVCGCLMCNWDELLEW